MIDDIVRKDQELKRMIKQIPAYDAHQAWMLATTCELNSTLVCLSKEVNLSPHKKGVNCAIIKYRSTKQHDDKNNIDRAAVS